MKEKQVRKQSTVILQDILKGPEVLSFFFTPQVGFFQMDNIKFIENRGCTKVRDISFKESVSNPTMVITVAIDSGMVIIPYIIRATHP